MHTTLDIEISIKGCRSLNAFSLEFSVTECDMELMLNKEKYFRHLDTHDTTGKCHFTYKEIILLTPLNVLT